MASLVANYGSDSESNSDPDEDETQTERKEQKVTNFFAENPDSSESEDELTKEAAEPEKKDASERLPNPLAGFRSSVAATKAQHSVFANQFQQAEDAKLSVLEQHVKLTKTEIPEMNDRKVCIKFRKGQCSFGKKCKYLHVEDPLNPPKKSKKNRLAGGEEVHDGQNTSSGHNYYGQQSYRADIEPEVEDEDSYMGQAKRKLRAGINDKLLPPKKAMRHLDNQRSTERPWTQKK